MLAHALRNWRAEKKAAWLYRVLSDYESGNPRQLLFLELASEADEQAGLWGSEIRKSGGMPPVSDPPGLRLKLVAWLIRRLGPQRLKSLLAMMKIRGLSVYSVRHRGTGQPRGRHAVIDGVNDGLVLMALLVAGVAGATEESATLLLTGVAGLLAGACSLAAGDWISTRSQHAVFESDSEQPRDELAPYPVEETAELVRIYQARGMRRDEADALARRMMDDPEFGLDGLVREAPAPAREAPDSPWQAAAFSFFAFVFGGSVPLLPFLLEIRHRPFLVAVSISCVALFAVGAILARQNGEQAVWGGLRRLLITVSAGGVAYLTGSFLGPGIR